MFFTSAQCLCVVYMSCTPVLVCKYVVCLHTCLGVCVIQTCPGVMCVFIVKAAQLHMGGLHLCSMCKFAHLPGYLCMSLHTCPGTCVCLHTFQVCVPPCNGRVVPNWLCAEGQEPPVPGSMGRAGLPDLSLRALWDSAQLQPVPLPETVCASDQRPGCRHMPLSSGLLS